MAQMTDKEILESLLQRVQELERRLGEAETRLAFLGLNVQTMVGVNHGLMNT